MPRHLQPVIDVRRIRAITLDLDNTLWEINPVIYRAEETLWQWLGEHYPRVHHTFAANDLLTMRQQVREEHQERHFDLRFLRKKVLQRVAIRAGYDESLVEPAFKVFDDVRNDVELYPDVLAELETLFTRFTIVALTNGNSNLEKIGIRHLFHGVVTAVSAGAAKPERRIFAAAVAETGVAPDEILHVGDHPEADIHGAREAGFRTAWINRNGDSWPQTLPAPDAVVTDMSELRELLEAEA